MARSCAPRNAQGQKSPKAIGIISDGGANNSNIPPGNPGLVREADVQIYAHGCFNLLPAIFSEGGSQRPRLLSQLAEQNGRPSLRRIGCQRFASVAARIAVELRNQYVLAYRSSNTK